MVSRRPHRRFPWRVARAAFAAGGGPEEYLPSAGSRHTDGVRVRQPRHRQQSPEGGHREVRRDIRRRSLLILARGGRVSGAKLAVLRGPVSRPGKSFVISQEVSFG